MDCLSSANQICASHEAEAKVPLVTLSGSRNKQSYEADAKVPLVKLEADPSRKILYKYSQ